MENKMLISEQLEQMQIPICGICDENPQRINCKTCSPECSKERTRLLKRRHYDENIERYKELGRQLYKKNIEKYKEYARLYRQKNRERMNRLDRERYWKNKLTFTG